MKVWELMSQLSELPAGADVMVRIRWDEIDKHKTGWFVGVADVLGNNEPDEPAAVLFLQDDLSKIMAEFKRGVA
jgi:hypothetical protein